MTTIITIGGQWGDEGKGKIVDYLARVVKPGFGVRFNGGANAGHSIVNENGSFALHLIPSTIFTPGALSVLSNGVVIDPEALLKEMDELILKGVDISGLRLSDKCHLTLPWHRQMEAFDETLRGDDRIGTTKRGIGPTYSDKVGRGGLRLVDLQGPRGEWEGYIDEQSERYYSLFEGTEISGWDPAEIKRFLGSFYDRIRGYITNTEDLLWEAQENKATILMEGAQGTLLDVEFGTYPKVTSSTTTRLGVYQGTGLPPTSDEVVFGVFKGYITRVGEGPFPTELHDSHGKRLRDIGHEYGATTGRARRCGWFDAVLARYAHQLNRFDWLVLTKSDVMDTFETVRICVAYELDGKRIEHCPRTETELARCKPIYEDMPGWQTPTSEIRRFEDLPVAMQKYCRRLEELVGVRIGIISVGPGREETINLVPF